ncbi:similar to iron-sulfur cluster scaffold protein [Cyanidioschyzon merolae strain 10D]|uniref:Similar to iron-sulfur cluster scaffold protein n=1 Tax=Cyanidioschyzon merolae (strain NIES-3377 / 10D) TaxID=280699 RepID=M1USB3_CYAM1|nr:similar to iron-sulfur cluster scaffold protein [Cyanidioschyzon merolae strain 10D]BAM80566.1 similar to iron-sulfur cluster scaffold protein [Cyanidioschyzon merolae strain 10D]|eukprot:XP_005536602.1 similar to iron-sulfur cluster scaffold protein [Cyanidioschyzon merolae strain 10D]
MAFVGTRVVASRFFGAASKSSPARRARCLRSCPTVRRPALQTARHDGVALVQMSATSEPLTLSEASVEVVLDELRPYLMADGGNVSIVEIDGATVRLKLEGACGSCPSSTMTMKMGIEKRLRERIPEIESVVAVEDAGEQPSSEGVEQVLDQVRPFLKIAGGSIELVSMTNIDGPAPVVNLRLMGTGAAIQSVKVEISSRIRRRFPRIAQIVFT